jgi:hypothetical protein
MDHLTAAIAPITTVYQGCRFRSRLEARWAVVFDAAGINWHYEHEGYDLGELGWYLPDFWLPELNTHVEVKPNFATSQDTEPTIEEQKLSAVCKAAKTFGVFCTDLKAASPFQALEGEYGYGLSKFFWPQDTQWPEAVKRSYTTADFDRLKQSELIPDGKEFSCPICGENFFHIGSSENVFGNDYKLGDAFPGASIYSRGEYIAIDLLGECGHYLNLVLAFHKGNSDIGIVYDPEQDLSPVERIVKAEHLQAGMSARFEHREHG